MIVYVSTCRFFVQFLDRWCHSRCDCCTPVFLNDWARRKSPSNVSFPSEIKSKRCSKTPPMEPFPPAWRRSSSEISSAHGKRGASPHSTISSRPQSTVKISTPPSDYSACFWSFRRKTTNCGTIWALYTATSAHRGPRKSASRPVRPAWREISWSISDWCIEPYWPSVRFLRWPPWKLIRKFWNCVPRIRQPWMASQSDISTREKCPKRLRFWRAMFLRTQNPFWPNKACETWQPCGICRIFEFRRRSCGCCRWFVSTFPMGTALTFWNWQSYDAFYVLFLTVEL